MEVVKHRAGSRVLGGGYREMCLTPRNDVVYSSMQSLRVKETTEYNAARVANADRWVTACGGFERPYLNKNGVRVLYVWNFRTRKHGVLDLGQDIVFEDDTLTTVHG